MHLKNLLANFRVIEITITGVGFDSFINELMRENVNIISIKKPDNTTLKIKIRGKYERVTFAILKKRCYTYAISSSVGVGRAQAGVLLGFVFLLIALAVLSQFCFGVKVNSDNGELVSRVNMILQENNLAPVRAFGALDFEKIEQVLRDEIDEIGLVSVSRRGAYLWINFSEITEPDDVEQENTTGILATANGVVSRIFVHSGTALVQEGDTVSIGQMLIAPYYLDDEGNATATTADGDVYLSVWNSATVEFREVEQVMTRTGKTQVCSRVLFGNDILSDNTAECIFDNYESEKSVRYLSNILPVKIEYTTYYETQAITVQREYSAERDALIYEAREKAYSLVDEGDILDERVTESVVGEVYYVTYYVMTEIKV